MKESRNNGRPEKIKVAAALLMILLLPIAGACYTTYKLGKVTYLSLGATPDPGPGRDDQSAKFCDSRLLDKEPITRLLEDAGLEYPSIIGFEDFTIYAEPICLEIRGHAKSEK